MRILIFMLLFIALLDDFVANEKPLYCQINGATQFPAFRQKAIDWGLVRGDSTFAMRNWAHRDSYQKCLFPLIPYSATTISSATLTYEKPLQNGHLLGTDHLGRDVAAGIIHGFSVALYIGVGTTLLSLLLGISLGATAGYFGSWWDIIIMRIIEVKRTVPSLLWLLSILAIFSKFTIWSIILVLGILSWSGVALFARSEMLKVKTNDYINAAQAVGLSTWQIFWRHALPNGLTTIYILAASLVSDMILAESALSFLGLGLSANTVTWGSMLHQAQSNISAWWLALFPGLCIFGVVILCNLGAERLRKAYAK